MKIQLLGNCSVILTTEKGKIMLDPYFSNKGNIMFRRGENVSEDYKKIDSLDGILLSHEHFDHMDLGFLKKFKGKCPLYGPIGLKGLFFKRKTVSCGDKFYLKDMEITVVKAKHVCPTVGYIIKAENKSIYFSGDTYYREFMKDIASEFSIDVALLPVTNYMPPMTMDKESVAKALEILQPKYFIPMHKDLVKRVNPNNCTVTEEELRKVMKDNIKLVYLKNGQTFDKMV